ncbi:MAG: hypothetical protein LBT56_00055 [Prevotellaceae bacterium]|jgi:hypothetical protein|nr:hypothetical protein [Prevotellaceae bacterium]
MITGLITLYFFYRIFLCKNKEVDFNAVYPNETHSISAKNLLLITVTSVILAIAAVVGFIARLFKKSVNKH